MPLPLPPPPAAACCSEDAHPSQTLRSCTRAPPRTMHPRGFRALLESCVTEAAVATKVIAQLVCIVHQTTARLFLRFRDGASDARQPGFNPPTHILQSITSRAPRTVALSVLGACLASALQAVSGFTDRARRAAKGSSDCSRPIVENRQACQDRLFRRRCAPARHMQGGRGARGPGWSSSRRARQWRHRR